jgi:hypothetical protein
VYVLADRRGTSDSNLASRRAAAVALADMRRRAPRGITGRDLEITTMRTARLTGVMAVCAVAGAVVQTARADIIDITQPNVTLQQVLGNQFRVGDKLFTVAANGFASSRFSANQIIISAITNANPLSGQGFRLSGSFNDPPGDAAGSEFVLSFGVDILPEFAAQGFRFSDLDLRFNGAATGAGSFARVDETALNGNNQVLGNRSVFALGGGESHLEDHFDFPDVAPGLTHLNIVKDVQFFANGADGSATASFVDQSFSQFVIPLPTGAAMTLAGMAAIAVRRRRVS